MAAVDDGIGGLREVGADGLDKAILAIEVHSVENIVAVVAGDQGVQIFQQQGGHGTTLLSLLSV